MKVLVLEGSQKPPTFVQNLIRGLLDCGIEVRLMGRYEGARMKKRDTDKLSFVTYPVRGFTPVVLGFLKLCLINPGSVLRGFRVAQSTASWKLRLKRVLLYSHLFAYKPDVIHVQWATHLSHLEHVLKPRLFKVVVSLRGSQINITANTSAEVSGMFSRLFPLVDGFHAVSEAMAIEASRHHAPKEKIKVIHSIVRVPEATIRKIDQVDGPLRILAVGRFHWLKGYTHLLSALAILKRQHQQVKLTLLVQGEMPEEIMFQINDEDLTASVEWIQGLPHQEVLNRMSEHHVLVLPSIREGIANVVLEAMSVGLPVVSTNCGGMDEFIVDGVNGFLVPVRDPQALADSLLRIAKMSEEEIGSLIREAKRTIQVHFNHDACVREFVKLYEHTVACG